MPKNKGKGGKSKRKGKNAPATIKELVKKTAGQEYGQVIKLLGNRRLEIKCFDGITRLGHIKGKIGKRVWILKDDVVLMELRDYQDGKCDVVGKYTLQEIQTLKRLGEIPDTVVISGKESNDEDGLEEDWINDGEDESDYMSSESSDDDFNYL